MEPCESTVEEVSFEWSHHTGYYPFIVDRQYNELKGQGEGVGGGGGWGTWLNFC